MKRRVVSRTDYDTSGLVTNKVYADGKGPTYTYTPDGKLATRTWARGTTTGYTYDAWGNLTNTVYSDGTPPISLVYDAMGRQTNAVDAAGVATFTYDSFGSQIGETINGIYSKNIVRHYDSFGRAEGYASEGVRRTRISYEPATGRISGLKSCGVWFDNHYLAGTDLRDRIKYGNSGYAYYTYEPNRDVLAQVRNEFGGSVISQYDYVCDAIGSRIQIARSGTMMSESRNDAYSYNERNELISAGRAELVSAAPEYAYQYDDIGNRIASSEITAGRDELVSSAYAANSLNQYTSISNSALSASPREAFTPQFDDDGNQTLVQTSTGIWQIQYNGENCPVHWSNGATNITMKFDRMGRRVEYLETVTSDAGGSQPLATETNNHYRFVYDGYLCIQRLNALANNAIDLIFAWDPAEQIATRPLMIEKPSVCMLHITHDGNKNGSDLVFFNGGCGVDAHYEYAPFGALATSTRSSTSTVYDIRSYNPFRFSSEYADDALGLVYYNYRHYEPVTGRWSQRDLVETEDMSLMLFVHNASICDFDYIGLASGCKRCSDQLIDLLKNEDDLLLDGFKGLASLGGRCKLLFGCDTNCTSSSRGGYTSYRESGILWWKDVTITIRICANADGSLKNTENETRNTLIHELSHAADLCMTQNPFHCGSIGSDDMKRLICTEVRAYRYGNGIKDKSQCIERALNSVQLAGPHKRGTWAEYRSALRREAERVYDDCIKEVIR